MPTTDQNRLREQLIKSPFLVIDCLESEATLASKDEMLKVLGDRAFVVTHALRAFHNFAKLAGEQNEFSLTDITKIAGVPYSQAYNWMMEGVIIPSVRGQAGAGRDCGPVFSFGDAVAAGIVGSLRRQGLGLEIARLVAPLFVEPKKRTAGRIAAAKRS